MVNVLDLMWELCFYTFQYFSQNNNPKSIICFKKKDVGNQCHMFSTDEVADITGLNILNTSVNNLHS